MIEIPPPLATPKRRYADRSTERVPGDRPPHPFNEATDRIGAAPAEQRPALLRALERERGPRFAAVVRWALAERAAGGPVARCADRCGRPAAVKGYCDRCYHRRFREARREP